MFDSVAKCDIFAVHEEKLSLLKEASLFLFHCTVVGCSYFSVLFVISVNYWYQVRVHTHFHCYIWGRRLRFHHVVF